MALTKITSNAFAASAVDSDAVGANTITTAKIADNNVTHAKLHTDMNLSSKTVTLPTISSLTVSGGTTHLDGRNSAGLTLDLAGTGHYTIREHTTDDVVKLGGTGSVNFIAHNISSGNVGIGTDNPQALLHTRASVNNFRIEDADTSGYANIGVDNSGSLYLQADHGNTRSSSFIRFFIDGNEDMHLDEYGQLALTSNPSTFFLGGTSNGSFVKGTNTGNYLIFGTSAAEVARFTGNAFQLNGGGTIKSNGTADTVVLSGSTGVDVGGNITLHGNTHSNASQIFFKNGSTNVMTIAGGNVGINTASPSNKLTISGVGNETTANAVITINSTLTTTGATRLLGVREGSTQVAHIAYSHSNNDMEILSQESNGGITFFAGGISRRMKIASSGNVGIGTENPANLLHVNGSIQAGLAGNSSANQAALKLYASGTADTQAAIAIQQATYEGDTIIFGDYEPYIEFGISADNSHDCIDFTGGTTTRNIGVSKTFYNGSGNARTAYVKARIGLGDGIASFNTIRLTNGSQSTDIYTAANRTGMGSHSSSYVWMDNIQIENWRGALDRDWGDYPSITIQNDTTNGTQGEFRIHGIGGISGGDFSIVTRCDGGYLTGSDSRRKTNIESVTNALDIINQLDGKRFNVINKDLEVQEQLSEEATGKKFGFIAQDVQSIIPEAVRYYEAEDTPEENGYASAYSMDYASLVPVLTNAIKEQQTIIDDLKARIEALET